VWIRIRGQWHKGRIIEWITDPGGAGWDCLIKADEPFDGVPWQGRYVYDPATIRPRDGDTPPGELPPTSVHAVQDRPAPRALPARQEVHLHFHGIDAEDVAAILADVNRDRG
jgi:hypothetical protein